MESSPETEPTVTAHTTRNTTQQTHIKKPFFYRKAIAAVLILAIGSITLLTYLTHDALPGTTRYVVKTKLVEPAFAFTKFTAVQQANYETQRLQARLSELQTLSRDQSTSSPETLAMIAALSTQHAEHAMNALKKNQQTPTPIDIDAAAALATLTKSEVTLIDNTPEFESIADSTENTDRSVNSFLKTSIGTFASTSPTDIVYAYINTQIQAVSDESTQVAQGGRAATTIMRRISDTNEAIIDGDMSEAINAIIKARQAIAIDGYLWDAERGPIEGAPLPPTEIPEGN